MLLEIKKDNPIIYIYIYMYIYIRAAIYLHTSSYLMTQHLHIYIIIPHHMYINMYIYIWLYCVYWYIYILRCSNNSFNSSSPPQAHLGTHRALKLKEQVNALLVKSSYPNRWFMMVDFIGELENPIIYNHQWSLIIINDH